MWGLRNWWRPTDRPTEDDEARAYHTRRFVQEQALAREAQSGAARDAHRRLAAAHRVAMEQGDDAFDHGSGTTQVDAPIVP
ncbi:MULTISPECIES: hypothetical protein [unclassified Sphingomonas]|uniref:hypothetical protein n=1 Tax=unclassified Sphingomonas TaxID=196159 RepID=UPI0006FAB60E|nr:MULTISPECIES: hypothetical protein [unclassified Sphingomonas]KQN07302.1 hypothetical protein ASE78_13935 [Sphingomonas sp. Leaf25]KQN34184.1 hypothetical protein ASE97_16045 [Sphingomonas sp. Leaf42]KQT30627.1 hypothetical protein ASG37_06110 [Sphingomonas sp. Leaf407]